MTVKVVIFYNQFNRGWTETYYHSATTPDQFFAGIGVAQMNPFIDLRVIGTKIIGVRASVVGASRQSDIVRPYGLNNLNVLRPGPDIVSTTAYCQLSASSTIKRRVALRGLPDGQTIRDADGQDHPGQILEQRMTAYFVNLQRLGLQIRSLTAAGIGNPDVAVLSLAAHPTNAAYTNITFAAAPTWAAGTDMIIFHGVPRNELPGFKGTFLVKGIAGAVVTVAYRMRAGGTIQPVNMRARKALYSYASMVAVPSLTKFLYFGSRKTGRPFVSQAGKSSVAIRRQ